MRFRLILLFLCWSPAAAAQGIFSTKDPQDQLKWSAVGRLEVAGEAFCTGALIEPHIVLTAAHCVFDPATGDPIAVDEFRFLAGWRDGRAANQRRARNIAVHPAFDFHRPEGSDRVRNDLALVELQLPIVLKGSSPFETAAKPEQGAPVGVVSYAHNRNTAPQLEDTCHVYSKQDEILVLTCSVDFGASGSPVFTFEDAGQPRIVSVVSAKAEAEGRKVSLATDLQTPLIELRQELARQQNPDAGLVLVSARPQNGTENGNP